MFAAPSLILGGSATYEEQQGESENRLLDQVLEHQLPDLAFDSDRGGKPQSSSKPMRLH
jgi:hypothetical protein